MSDHYVTPDGRKVPRVSTVLANVGDAPALVKWKMRQVYDIVRADLTLEFSEAVAAMPTEARDWGSEVHDLLNRSLDIAASPRETVFPDTYLRAMEVKQWLADNGYEVVETEVVVVGDMYGGTIDLVCRHEGRTVIVDLKTGKGIYPNHAAQLAAYCRLWKQRPEATGEVLHAAILHAPRKGPIKLHNVNMRLADRLWQAALDWTTTDPILKDPCPPSPASTTSTPVTPLSTQPDAGSTHELVGRETCRLRPWSVRRG